MMQPYKVALIDVGEYLPISLQHFCKKLNSIQSSFYFEDAGSITSNVLGNPDVDDDWYDATTIFSIMKKNINSTDFNFVVGITQSKITNKTELVGKVEKNYFSLSDFQKFSIISMNRRVLNYNSPNKGNYRYLAHLVIGEVLMNLTKKNLNHLGQEPCLFNECEDRTILCECIERSRICPLCLAELKKNNVSGPVINNLLKILSWCRLNDWSFALKNLYQHPISSLGFGIGFGWLTSIFLTKDYYYIIVAMTFLPAVIVLFLSRFSKLN